MAFIKRLMDFILATVVLVLSFAFWPIIALAIKLDSRGPVFYLQRRVGKRGKLFTLIKFRSMIARAEENGPLWAQEDDDRITRVGRF